MLVAVLSLVATDHRLFGGGAGSGSSMPPRHAPAAALAASRGAYRIDKTAGRFQVRAANGDIFAGEYSFDPSSKAVRDGGGELVGTFFDDQVAGRPFSEDVLSPERYMDVPCITVVSSEIIAEVQNPDNDGAVFVLPSQLNGAEYPSCEPSAIVTRIDAYRQDRTGGPRGQLAVHPAAGQFMLDNAASDVRPHGIDAVCQVLAAVKEMMPPHTPYRMRVKNGYLELPDCPRDLQPMVLEGLRRALHMTRLLGMAEVPACGLLPSFQGFNHAEHNVTLVYASAVPVQAYCNSRKQDEAFQQEVGRLVIAAQYYGALCKTLDMPSGGRPSPRRVFLMPLGGGVFNNRIESICDAMSVAVEQLVIDRGEAALAQLDVRVLTFSGKPAEQARMTQCLAPFRKLRTECGPGAATGGAGPGHGHGHGHFYDRVPPRGGHAHGRAPGGPAAAGMGAPPGPHARHQPQAAHAHGAPEHLAERERTRGMPPQPRAERFAPERFF